MSCPPCRSLPSPAIGISHNRSAADRGRCPHARARFLRQASWSWLTRSPCVCACPCKYNNDLYTSMHMRVLPTAWKAAAKRRGNNHRNECLRCADRTADKDKCQLTISRLRGSESTLPPPSTRGASPRRAVRHAPLYKPWTMQAPLASSTCMCMQAFSNSSNPE